MTDTSLAKTESLLIHLPLFNEMSREEVSRIANSTRQQRIAKGETLFCKGDACEGFYVVVHGQMKLCLNAANGAEKVIEIISAGQSFGEAVMFLDRPYPVTAQALQDTLLVHVPKIEVFEEIARDDKFARKMLAGLSIKLHRLVSDVELYSLQSSMQRVIGFLLQQEVVDAEGRAHISLTTGKAVIASRLNITPETFSRILNELTAAGLIAVQGKEILINSVEKLRGYGSAG